jgi:N6-L-threonylcarbamoyladenine synthase
MRVLGVESSCDETAASVVSDDGPTYVVHSDVVSSQVTLHAPYGGVVPELASRHHLLNIVPVVEEALRVAGAGPRALDGVAVTRGPGLVGALLVGVQFGKGFAYANKLPLVGVNHLEGHLTSVYLREPDEQLAVPGFPHVALLCSGGHTELHAVLDFGEYRLLGATRDDAAGEAFDKGAKVLGLGYPGGVRIQELARGGDPHAVKLPRAFRGESLEFSFSGLKTALALWWKAHAPLSDAALRDLCASYQQAIVDVLVDKTRRAARWSRANEIVLAGGVAANEQLRRDMDAVAVEEGWRLYVPKLKRCTDNAAMIAAAGLARLRRGERAGLDLNADASLALG